MKKNVLAQPWLGASFRKFLLVAIFLAFTSSFAQTTVPLNESFESESIPFPWAFITPSGSVDWEIDDSYSHSGSYSAAIGYQNQKDSWLVTPKLSPQSGDSIKFWLMLESPTNFSLCDTFAVMISTTNTELENFTALETVWNGETTGDYTFTEEVWTYVAISLEDYVGEEIYLAFKKSSSGNCGVVWLDDVSGVDYITPTCLVPGTVASTTNTTATITLTTNTYEVNTYNLYYKKSTDTEYNEPITISATDDVLSYTIEDLEAGTIYDYYVEIFCGEEDDTLQTAVKTFITACEAITEFPWTEGFEDDWLINTTLSDNVTAPLCWSNFSGGYVNSSNSCKWKQTKDYSNSGTSSATMYSDYATSSHNDWLITPKLALTGNQQITFYARSRTSSELDEISVWISDSDVTLTAPTNPNDTSALVGFTEIANFGTIPAAWEEYIISLAGYSGNRQIAFVRKYAPYDGYYLYLDDVTVEEIPSCVKISQATSTVTPTTATITVVGDQESSYVAYYKKVNEADWSDPVEVNNLTLNLTGLTSATEYQYYFATVCDEDTAFSKIFKFTTECASITASDLPRFWDFESGNVPLSSSSSNKIPKCWQHISNSAYSIYVSTSSYDAYQGTNSLEINYTNDIAIMPEIDTDSISISDLQISLFAFSDYYYSNTSSLIFGVMTDPTNSSSFEAVDTIDINDSYAYYEVQFEGYVGTGKWIAIKPGTSSGSFYMDNLTLEHKSSCAKIQNSTVETTINSATVTIAEDEIEDGVAYQLYYKENNAASWEEPVMFVDGVAQIESGLKHSTVYDYMIVSVCSDESEVEGLKKVFTTTCANITAEDLPYTWNFEGTATGGTSSNPLPPCWSFSQSSDMARIYSSSEDAYQGDKFLNFHSTTYYDPTYIALPQIDTESVTMDHLQLSFYAKKNYDDYSKLEIGISTNPASADEFVLWDVVDDFSTTYKKYTFNFTNYDQGGAYIVIRTPENNMSEIYIDNMELSFAPECVSVSSTATTTTNSANITLKGKADASYVVYYKQVDAEEWTSAEVSDLQAEISDLQHSTAYQYYVATICGEDTLTSDVKTILTSCVTIDIEDLPITWNFEQNNYGGNPASPMPTCWQRVDNGNDNPYVSTYDYYAYEGTNSLYFHSYYDGYAIMPLINSEIPLDTLQLTFYAKNSSYYGSTSNMEIGVMSDPTDITTYETITTIEINGTYTLYTVRFLGYTGDAGYIVLKYVTNSDFSAYIDSLTLGIVPDCQEILPADITSETITTTTAEVTIDAKEGKSYKFYYKTSNSTNYGEAIMFDAQNKVSISELTPATNYDYYIVTLCDEEDSAISSIFNFQTSCNPINPSDLPKIWDFETNNTAGTETYPLPVCWQRMSSDSPSVSDNSNYANSGSHFLAFSGYVDVDMVVLQEINTDSLSISDLQLSFYMRNASGSAEIQVGTLTDPSDASTFTVLSTISENSYSYVKKEMSLMDAPEGDKYIALKGIDYSTIFIDDITLDKAPACPTAVGMKVEAAQTTATITWNQGGDGITSWKLYYREEGSTDEWLSVDVADSSKTTLTNLTQSTSYEYYIEGICSEEGGQNPQTTNLTFKTLCPVITVTNTTPWVEDFSNDNALDCWTYVGWNVTDGELFHMYSSNKDNGITPMFDITAVTSPHLAFKYNITAFYGYIDNLIVKYRAAITDEWMELASYTTETEDEMIADTLALPNPSATYQINFFFDGNDANGITIDDVTIFNNDNVPMPCNTPTNLTLTDSSLTSLTISWEGTASKYKVQKNNDTPIEVTQNSYTFNGLTPNTSYNFKVQSVCDEETSDWSAVFTAKTLDIACDDVTALSVSATTQTTATITWNGTASGYDVKLGENGNIQNISVTTYTFTDLTANTTYTAMVRSNCGNGKTSQWQSVTFKTDPEAAEDCYAPTDLTVGQITQTSAVVTWTGTANSYEVQVGISEPVKVTTNSYSIEGLTASSTYTVKVRSICSEEKQSEFVPTTFKTLDDESGLIDIDNSIVIATYPNPTTTNATLEVKGLTQAARVIVTDVMGRVVASDILQAGQQVLTINSESFAQGVYYIRVVNDQINKTSTLIKK